MHVCARSCWACSGKACDVAGCAAEMHVTGVVFCFANECMCVRVVAGCTAEKHVTSVVLCFANGCACVCVSIVVGRAAVEKHVTGAVICCANEKGLRVSSWLFGMLLQNVY